jgi:hypothetical protein
MLSPSSPLEGLRQRSGILNGFTASRVSRPGGFTGGVGAAALGGGVVDVSRIGMANGFTSVQKRFGSVPGKKYSV